MCQVSLNCPPSAGDTTAYQLPIHQNKISNKHWDNKAQPAPGAPESAPPHLCTTDPRFWPQVLQPLGHTTSPGNTIDSLPGFTVSPGPAGILPWALREALREAGVSLLEQSQAQQGHPPSLSAHHRDLRNTVTSSRPVEQVTQKFKLQG